MAFDEVLADRVRRTLAKRGEPAEGAYSEKKMFGGLCFLVGGNMCCGVAGSELMVRVGPEAYEESLAQPHAREMDFTGRPLRGMVFVEGGGVASDADLAAWVARGADYAGSLPPK